MTPAAFPYPRETPSYEFEVKSLLDVYEQLTAEILHWVPGCAFLLGGEAAGQRRSPPFIIWDPTDAALGGSEQRKGKDKPFRSAQQTTRALCVGRPAKNETDPVRASFKGTEHLTWALLWSLQKNFPGSHNAPTAQYVRREASTALGHSDTTTATGLSQAAWASMVTWSISLSLQRPEQRAAVVEQVEVEPEISFTLDIPR